MTTHPAIPGQTVIYHGSIEEAHGPATYRGVCDADEPCTECDATYDLWEFYRNPGLPPIRYRLSLYGGTRELRCVRAESFTAVVADTTATELCERCSTPDYDLDPESGLCSTCSAYNASRVVL